MPGGKLILKGLRHLPAVVEKGLAKRAGTNLSTEVASKVASKRALRLPASRRSVSKRFPNGRKTIDIAFEEVKDAAIPPSKWAKFRKWVASEGAGLGAFLAVDWAIDQIFGDGGSESPVPDDVADAVDRQLGLNSGHRQLLDSYEYSVGRDKWLSIQQGSMSGLYDDILFSKASIAGSELPDSLSQRCKSLTPSERAIGISYAIRLAKELAESAPEKEIFNLLVKQMACSSVTNASVTQGFVSALNSGILNNPDSALLATEQSLMYESLYEEIRNEWGDTFFNKATTIWDLFDLFDKNLSDVDPSVTRSLILSSMSSDDTTTSQKGWFDKWRVDKDGEDDESRALKLMINLSSVSRSYSSMVQYIMDDQDAKADQLFIKL